MRSVRAVLSTLVALAIGLRFALGATPQLLAAYLVLVAVLVLIPAMMIDGDTRVERPEAAIFVVSTVLASCWLLLFDGGPSVLPWLPFGAAWLTGLGSLLVAVRVKRRNGGVVSGEVLEALAGWPAMRQFNTSVTAPAASPDLRPPDLRAPVGDDAGSARRRLREQGLIGPQPPVRTQPGRTGRAGRAHSA